MDNEKQEDRLPELGTALMNSSTREELNVPVRRLASGKTLRREYIYKQRDGYIIENQKVPSEDIMEQYAQKARELYIHEGDYSVEIVNGQSSAIYLGHK